MSTMSKANLSEACNTLEVSRVFLLGCTQTKRDTRYTRAHTHHTHTFFRLRMVQYGCQTDQWSYVVITVRCTKGAIQGLVWCARHKKHTSTTATLAATKFLAKLIEIQIENHGMYPS